MALIKAGQYTYRSEARIIVTDKQAPANNVQVSSGRITPGQLIELPRHAAAQEKR
ncbi:hypothetical protein MJA45_06590 [Paenibacillus aurantius]|uniref:Uncharacterized protein n=1 Tax=Paenibacillus aurantius TaxID=2918900 RepID=A0AA96LGA6_9BACL|nr:hypothetical protein [Paenibacillus aurantius]WNQ12694.1 hypothetical protein MJA45_06590 [Paenibacillus aurantius]